jgi:hypothetical protein
LQRLRRRDIILLSGLLMLACTSLITVGLLILRYQSTAPPLESNTAGLAPRPQPVHTVTYTEVTGLSQYQVALREGQAWAPDAALVSASASWPQTLSVGQVGEPADWHYRFYSPAKERLFIVNVAPDQQVSSVEHRARITLPPALPGVEQWVIDSPAALAIWLDYGGAELVQRNPGLEVLIELRRVRNHDGPVWMVIGLDKRTQDIHVVVVDASEGLVVPTEVRF